MFTSWYMHKKLSKWKMVLTATAQVMGEIGICWSIQHFSVMAYQHSAVDLSHTIVINTAESKKEIQL